MEHRDYPAKLIAGILIVTVAMVAMAHFSYSDVASLSGVDSENGMLESLQQVLIALSGFAFLAGFFSSQTTLPKERSLILVAICITFLLRETDVASQSGWLSFWLDELGKKLTLIATWLLVIFYVFAEKLTVENIKANMAFDGTFGLLVLAASFLLIGWTMDREFFPVDRPVFIEEVSEAIGYAILLLAGHSFLWNRGTATRSRVPAPHLKSASQTAVSDTTRAA